MQEIRNISHISQENILDELAYDKKIPAKSWDFVLTCYEPLTNVTGGIGTYSRLLLRILNLKKQNYSILFICSADIDERLKPLLSGVTTIIAPPREKSNDLDLHALGDGHMRFSFAVAEVLSAMEKQGHRFQFIEFPDYGTEAYFTLKMRRHGQLAAGKIAIRLHSPHLMLLEDNDDALYQLHVNQRKVLAYEVFGYRHADLILYGADAMRDRVQAICDRFGIDLSSRAIKIPHPLPAAELFAVPEPEAPAKPANETAPQIPEDALVVTYVGRLEKRKGIAHFFETLSASPMLVALLKQRKILFQLAGRDLPHDELLSNGDVIRSAIEKHGLTDHVLFLGNVDQDRLAKIVLPRSDAFLFPSIFENYPNALLETLAFGKPTLISARGGMPELARPYPNMVVYDPLMSTAGAEILGFLTKLSESGFPTHSAEESRALFQEVAEASNAAMIESYAELVARPPVHETPQDVADAKVAFVIPHYNNAHFIGECLKTVLSCAEPGDEIIVSDDLSTPEQFAALEAFVARLNVFAQPQIRVLSTTINGGPSVARNRGVQAIASADWIQFIDADDMLAPAGFHATRKAMRLNPDLDMAYGVQRTFGTKNHYWIPIDSDPSTVLDENICHSAILIRKTVFDRLGGFAPELRLHFEDWEFNGRFCMAGFKGELVLAITQLYRAQEKSRTTEYRERVTQSRQRLLSHIARCRSISGEPHLDAMAAALAGYASTMVYHDLMTLGAEQVLNKVNIHLSVYQDLVRLDAGLALKKVELNLTIRRLRDEFKAMKIAGWRRLLVSLLLSGVKKLSGIKARA